MQFRATPSNWFFSTCPVMVNSLNLLKPRSNYGQLTNRSLRINFLQKGRWDLVNLQQFSFSVKWELLIHLGSLFTFLHLNPTFPLHQNKFYPETWLSSPHWSCCLSKVPLACLLAFRMQITNQSRIMGGGARGSSHICPRVARNFSKSLQASSSHINLHSPLKV